MIVTFALSDPWSTSWLAEIVPPAPADEVSVYWLIAKVAAMVWLEVTFVNVYEPTAPIDVPSTSTSLTW